MEDDFCQRIKKGLKLSLVVPRFESQSIPAL